MIVNFFRDFSRIALCRPRAMKTFKGKLLNKSVTIFPDPTCSLNLMRNRLFRSQIKSTHSFHPLFKSTVRRMSSDRDVSLIAAFYKKITEIYASSIDSTSYFQLLSNGINISLDTYANSPPRSTTNPQGDLKTTEEFSQLASMTFDLDGRLTTTKVEQAYGTIINVASSEQPNDPSVEKTLSNIHNLLFVKVKEPVTGKKMIMDSIPYSKYKQSLQKYHLALAKIQAAKFNYDFSRNEALKKWEIDGIEFQEKAFKAKKELETEVSIAKTLSYLNTAGSSAVQYVIDTARDNFDNSSITSLVDGLKYHIAYGIPSGWYSDPDLFSTISISEKDSLDINPATLKNYAGLNTFKNGIFSLNPSLEKPNPQNRRPLTSKKINYQFDLTTVAIQRPWLDPTLFSLTKWHINGFPAGKISKGVLPGNDSDLRNRILPYYSTAFVIVKNVEISGSWSSEDFKILKSSTQPGSSVSMGPFTLSGSNGPPLPPASFTSSNVYSTFKIPGAQIIGVINSIIPFSAPDPG